MKRTAITALSMSITIAACNCGDEGGLYTRKGRAEADPMIIDFGSVQVGSATTRSIKFTNVGDGFLTLQTATAEPGAIFSISQLPSFDAIPSGNESSATISFTPTSEGSFSGLLTLAHDGTNSPLEVTLLGTGVFTPPPCTLSAAPMSVQFPTQVGELGTASIELSAATECNVTEVRIDGPDATQFAVDVTAPFPIASASAQTITIEFNRTNAAAVSGMLVITSDDPSSPITIPLSAGALGAGLCVNPTTIQFGAVQTVASQDVSIEACGGRDVQITGLNWTMQDPEFDLVSPPSVPFTVNMGSTQMITVRYQPADESDDQGVLRIESDDPIVPFVDVGVAGSRDIVPEEVGRFLYYWQVDNLNQSNVMRVPLQGGGTAAPYWGQGTGRLSCPGCHQVSPDGRYIAVIDISILGQSLYVVDTQSQTRIQLPPELRAGSSFSWKPDVGGSRPYSFVAGVNGDLHLGSVNGGYVGPLAGANEAAAFEAMPSWGPDGKIVFVRGSADATAPAAGHAFAGPTDLVLVPEDGGTAQLLPGASQNGAANYYPAYAPNGLWIAYTKSAAAQSSYAAPDARVELVSSDLQGIALPLNGLNVPNSASSFPTWSLDATYLSISSNRPGGAGSWDVYIVPIDSVGGMITGPEINLSGANTAGFEHAAQWSP